MADPTQSRWSKIGSPQGHPAVHVGPSDDGGPESLIEEQGEYLELTENDHALLADLLQKAEEAGEDVIHPIEV